MKPARIRFGRNVPAVPNLRISREFTSLFDEEHARELCAEADGLPSTATWEEICIRRASIAIRQDQ